MSRRAGPSWTASRRAAATPPWASWTRRGESEEGGVALRHAHARPVLSRAQMPHMVLAAYYHAVNTGDTAALTAWMPALDRVMGYMLGGMGLNGSTHVLINTQCDGRRNTSCAGECA